jgi:hypothetical protein
VTKQDSLKFERFGMRIDPAWMKRVDEWRRRQDDLPTRAEAIRRLVDLGLTVKTKGARS